MTNLPSIKNIKPRGKFVLVRVDFNVLNEKGKIEDDYRIKRTLPAINFLKKKGVKIILISHLSDGHGKSLRPVAEFLKIKFLPGKNFGSLRKRIGKMKNGEIVLLENLRNFKGEEENGKKFAEELSGLADVYINEAFSASHRNHASIVGIPKYLPSYAGLLFQEELKHLRSAFHPKRPFLLILGGIKFKTKLGVLDKFIKIADKVFVGGALANNFLKMRGIDIGKSAFDKSINIKKYLDNPKIILPIDFRKENGAILDCGPKTVKMLKKLISQSKFILWNGPLGDIEKKGFEKGTVETAKAIARSRAKSIVGGGDTIGVLEELNILHKFTFVSTAGGAMLEFLAKGTLPGIEALKRAKKTK